MDRYQARLFAGACTQGDMNALRKFFEEGVDVFEANIISYSRILMGSFNSSKYQMLELFIEQDWDPTYIDSESYRSCVVFIYRSVETAGLTIVRLLLSVGYEFDVNKNLREARERGDLESAKLLIEYGDELNENIIEALLHCASQNGHVHIASFLLLELDFKVGINDDWTIFNPSFLHTACANNQYEMAAFLLQQGADPNKITNGVRPLLHDVCRDAKGIHFMQLLLEYGIDVNLVSNVDCSLILPIHIACFEGNYAAVQLLVKAGASLCRDTNGMSPEDYLRTNLRQREQRQSSSQEERLQSEEALALLAAARRSERNRQNIACCIVT